MWINRAVIVFVLAIALSGPNLANDVQPSPGGLDALQRAVETITSRPDAVVGLAVQNLDTGDGFSIRGEERFPMASTFKVALAAFILLKVEKGDLQVGDLIPVVPDDYVVSSTITDHLPHAGISLSVQNLLELMLTESDNTATDVLMRLAGGAREVTAWLESIGIKGQRVDRNTAELLKAFYDLGEGSFLQVVAEAEAENPDVWRSAGQLNSGYDDDIRDTSTPLAMTQLLSGLFRSHWINEDSKNLLLEIMYRCRTGVDRIKGLLPADTAVAHKTGTLGASANDVGMMVLPSGERVIISVFVKKAAIPAADRDRIIAEVARLTYDYFLLRS